MSKRTTTVLIFLIPITNILIILFTYGWIFWILLTVFNVFSYFIVKLWPGGKNHATTQEAQMEYFTTSLKQCKSLTELARIEQEIDAYILNFGEIMGASAMRQWYTEVDRFIQIKKYKLSRK